MNIKDALSYAKFHLPSMIEALEILVNHESPSRDKSLLDMLSATLMNRFTTIGAKCELLPAPKQGNHVRIHFPASKPRSDMKPALILGHFDTVWPAGTLTQRPFYIEGEIAYGPGAFDMKGGIVIIEYALRMIQDLQLSLPRPVVVLLNSDEEIGSPHSRSYIKRHAKGSEYVLVLEPALSEEELKTERKGVGAFEIKIEGRAAHAGSEPGLGTNAIVELAHQILQIQKIANPDLGTTINVGRVSGGTRSNVVPAFATARIDSRVWTMEEARRVEKAFQNLQPKNQEAKLGVSGGFGRPPMVRLPGTAELFESAASVGRELGLTLVEGKTGGASDGNFCTALGIPTLDGLGVTGFGAHADHEQVNITSLPERAVLLAGILCTAMTES
jgi:glutamate carboxypeptidase